MKYDLYTEVSLDQDLPEHGLCRGDICTIVDYYSGSLETPSGYTVEFSTSSGEVIKVVTLEETKLKTLSQNSILAGRELSVH